MRKFLTQIMHRKNSLGSAAIILMLMVIISGLLGLIRLRVLYGRFTPEQTGVFFAAFRIPNLLFELLAMGALTSAFIPVFTKYVAKGKQEDAFNMAATVINLMALVFALLCIPIMIWTPQVSRFFAPGFRPDQIQQMASYTRIMVLLQVVPLIVGNFFTGILQSYNLFLVPAFAPILYNAGMIIGILIFSSTFGLYSAVLGVGIGAVAFMLVQLPLIIGIGYRHRWHINPNVPGVAEVWHLILPRMIGLGVSQIDVTVDLMLGSFLGSKMISVFYLAQSLQQLPVRLFGATISQAALPTLSVASANENRDHFKQSVMAAYHMVLFFVLPASVAFIVLRIPVVRIVFGASLFDWEATVLTALTLSMFSISLFAQAIAQVFTRSFYALYDSRTPVGIGVITILLNTVISITFIFQLHLPVWSLGLSTSIASIVNALLLLLFLYRRIGGFEFADVVTKPLKMVISSVICGFLIYIPLKLFDQLVFDTTHVFGLIMLSTITGGIGLAGYVFISWVLGVREVHTCFKLLDKLKHLRTIFVDTTSEASTEGLQNKV